MQTSASNFIDEDDTYYADDLMSYDSKYEDSSNVKTKSNANAGLWRVNDDLVNQPHEERFTSDDGYDRLIQMIYDHGGEPIMSGVQIPKGMIDFLKQKLLPMMHMRPPICTPIDSIIERVFYYLDFDDPYFFLSDMPISLSDENFRYTFKHRKNGSTFDPAKIEVFKVNKGWGFPHYLEVHKILSNPMIQDIFKGHQIPKPNGDGFYTLEDAINKLGSVIYGPNFTWFSSLIDDWRYRYYEDEIFDAEKGGDLETLSNLKKAQERDWPVWACIAIGVLTWLKSPYGLRFLMRYHPIYNELLDFDEEKQKIVMDEKAKGFVVVDGWSIYSGRDIDVYPGVVPGTCEISKQNLHCTKLVNITALKSPCFCGGGLRDILSDTPYHYDREHQTAKCKAWDRNHEPEMKYVCYAVVDNYISGRDVNTKCQRHSCPATYCQYHAGYDARLKSLTENRVRMLTNRKQN